MGRNGIICTIGSVRSVVVIIVSRELTIAVACHCVPSIPHSSSNSESVLILGYSYSEGLIGEILYRPIVFHHHIDSRRMSINGSC